MTPSPAVCLMLRCSDPYHRVSPMGTFLCERYYPGISDRFISLDLVKKPGFCKNACSYCNAKHKTGKIHVMYADEIIKEVAELMRQQATAHYAATGYKTILLLCQSVEIFHSQTIVY